MRFRVFCALRVTVIRPGCAEKTSTSHFNTGSVALLRRGVLGMGELEGLAERDCYRGFDGGTGDTGATQRISSKALAWTHIYSSM
jgi:hypothetical protein